MKIEMFQLQKTLMITRKRVQSFEIGAQPVVQFYQIRLYSYTIVT